MIEYATKHNGNLRYVLNAQTLEMPMTALYMRISEDSSIIAGGLWIEQPNNMWGLHTFISKESVNE